MWATLKQHLWQRRGMLITLPTVAAIVVTLRFAEVFQLWEWVALDQMFRLRPLESADPRIVIVTINESDIQRIGRYPISDAVLAQLLTNIQRQHPRVVGLDLYRNLPIEPGQQQLNQVFATMPNLIGIEKVVGNAENQAIVASPLLSQGGQSSASDFVLDADGRLRRSLLYLNTADDRIIFTLGTRLALDYLKAEGVMPQTIDQSKRQFQLGNANLTPLQPNSGGYVWADTGGYQILANFRRLRQSFQTVSMTAVLQGQTPPNLMRDRVVLIGLTAESLEDRFYTAYTTSPDTASAGVEIHAQVASQLLSAALEKRPLLQVWSEPWEWLWIWVWSGIGATLGWGSTSPRRMVLGSLLLGVLLLGSAYLALLIGWWLMVIPPLVALVGAATISNGYRLWENLQLSHRQLADYARSLEQRVEQRTEELAQEKETLQIMFDHIPIMIVLYDEWGQVQFANRQLEQVLGWSHIELCHVNQIADFTLMDSPVESETSALGQWLDFQIRTKFDRTIETSWATIRLSNGMKISIGQDITERLVAVLRDRKQAEEASVLEERNRMAREIHDTLAQAFTGVILQLEAASELLTELPEGETLEAVQICLIRMYDLAQSGLTEARRSVRALRSQLLEDGNLCSAFSRLAAQMEVSMNVNAACQISGTVYSLSSEIESNLLRIGQEALTNAVKHANASEIQIELAYETEQCILQIKDNGRGFEIDKISTNKGYGLLGMRERAKRIGARLTIQSYPGQGTIVAVFVDRE